MISNALEGVFPAMVTPFTDGGNRIDLNAIPAYCDFLIERKVDGLFVGGTTGEGPLMSPEERKILAKCVVERVQLRVKTICHTGALTTMEAVELTVFARDIGFDAVAVVAPFFYLYNDLTLRSHFEQIANAVSGFPVFVYSLPQCANNHISSALLGELFAIENIVGVKASNPDFAEIESYLRVREDKHVFIGNDLFDLPALKAGAIGIVSGNASAFPEPFVRLYRAIQSGDIDLAARQQETITDLAREMGYGRNPSQYKHALAFRGIPGGQVRQPHRGLTAQEESKLKDYVARFESVFRDSADI